MVYICDICGTQSAAPMNQYILPVRYMESSGWNGRFTTAQVYICEDCVRRIDDRLNGVLQMEFREFYGSDIRWRERETV